MLLEGENPTLSKIMYNFIENNYYKYLPSSAKKQCFLSKKMLTLTDDKPVKLMCLV